MDAKIDRSNVQGDVNVGKYILTFSFSLGASMSIAMILGIFSAGFAFCLILVLIMIAWLGSGGGTAKTIITVEVCVLTGSIMGISGAALLDPTRKKEFQELFIDFQANNDVPKTCKHGILVDINILERKDAPLWDGEPLPESQIPPDPRGVIRIGGRKEKLVQRDDTYTLRDISFFRGEEISLDQSLEIDLYDDDFRIHEIIVQNQAFRLRDLYGDDFAPSKNGQMEMRIKCQGDPN